MVTTELNLTVGPDGIVRVPAALAKPGETVTLRIKRPANIEPEEQLESDEPVRLTRLTAKTPEQKERLLREIEALAAQLAPMVRSVPDSTDWLYDFSGLPA